MSIHLILNANAGSAITHYDELLNAARRHGCQIATPDSLSSFSSAIKTSLDTGCTRLIVAGGDGTISRAANELGPKLRSIELAVIPLGTGNDLARCLGIPSDDIEVAMKIACESDACNLDIVKVHGEEGTRYFLNAACGGFGGEMARDLQTADKQRWGPFAYWMTAVSKLMGLHTFDVELIIDSKYSRHSVYGVTIANGRYVGGGFPIAADAILNDGFLDVVIIPVLPSLELLGAGLNLMIDKWYRPDAVQAHKAKRVVVRSEPAMHFSVDGEPRQAIESSFEIIAQGAKFVIGDAPDGVSQELSSLEDD